MPGALSTPAPSPSLLRFLRAQSQGLSFFDTNHGVKCTLRASSGALLQQPPCNMARQSRQWSRTLCTSKPKKSAVMQAGLWDLDAILPKSFQKQRSLVDRAKTSRVPNTQRYLSSDRMPSAICRPSWREMLWGRATGKPRPLNPEDLPSRDERGGPGSIFSPSRTQAAKAALEPRLRCTEVDENGEVILTDGEFKKSELIAKVWGKGIYRARPDGADKLDSMASCPATSAKSTHPISRIFLSDPPLFFSTSSI